MSSKAGKLRGKLGSFAKEREEFEAKKRELQEQMDKEKQNMGKIRKGLRGNDLKIQSHDSEDTTDEELGSRRMKSTKSRKSATEGSTPASEFFPKMPPIPTGPKLSDWAYTGTVDSSPPVIKQQELYEEVRFLGRGAYGTVDLVKNRDNNVLYASKTLLLQSKNEEAEFMHEVQFLRANRHPFIVHLHDVFITTNPKKIFIVMHYCGGGDLGKVIAMADKSNTPIPEGQILKWIGQIGMAIAYIHSCNIAHRDIKPVNILLSDNGEVAQLADFGLATELSSGKEKSTAEVGTPYYTSPEMISNEPCTLASDAWSFGVLLFEALSLQLPFDGASTVDLVRSILTDPPRMTLLPEGVYSSDINDVIEGLLMKDPVARFTIGDALKHEVLYNRVGALPSLYRPKHLEERLRRYHVRQMTQQLDELGIHSTQAPSAPRASQRPRLETLESGAILEGCVASSLSVSSDYHDGPALKYHPPTSASASTSGTSSHRQQHPRRLPGASQSATAAEGGDSASTLPSVPLNSSGDSDINLLPDDAKGLTPLPDAELFAIQRSNLEEPDCVGSDRVDANIHKHGVGAIDHASKYLYKHNLSHVEAGTVSGEGSGEDGVGVATRTSPRGSPRTFSPRAFTSKNTIPTSSVVSKKSPRLQQLETDRHVPGNILMSVSACPSPKPPENNEVTIIFPARSNSDGVTAVFYGCASITDQLQPSPSLPPLVSSRPSSARPPSASSTTREGSSQPTVSLFSSRRSSPRASPCTSPRPVLGTGASASDEHVHQRRGIVDSQAAVKVAAEHLVTEVVKVEVEVVSQNQLHGIRHEIATVDNTILDDPSGSEE